MKKLLIATGIYPPEIGGPATYVRELEEGLKNRFKICVVKFSSVSSFPKVIRHILFFVIVLFKSLRHDIILALDPVSVGLPSMYAAKMLRKPFIVKIVGDYAWEQGVQRYGVTQSLDEFVKTQQTNKYIKRFQKIQKRVANEANKVLVPSPYLKDVVMQWGIIESKITIINNAVTIPVNLPIRKKDKNFLVVSAGRRVPWKGFEAIEALRESHPSWQIEIISGRPREEVLSWMKAADVFVLNSLYEGFPHALVEAMTLGTPIVATNTRANKNIAGESGLFIEPEDGRALENALSKIEKDPIAAKERAQKGRERMKQFELQAMLDTTAHFLDSI